MFIFSPSIFSLDGFNLIFHNFLFSSSFKIHLDISRFDQQLELVGVSVPSQHTGAWLTALKSTGAGLHRSQLPLVREDEEDASRRVLVLSEALSESLKARGLPSADGVSREALPEALSLALREEGLLREARLRECLVNVTARHLNLQEMLRQSLPEGLPEPPSAYETVGHIAHVNLRDEFLPYRF